jgi:hypothetical protein
MCGKMPPGKFSGGQQIPAHAFQQRAEMQQPQIGCVNRFFQGTIHRLS